MARKRQESHWEELYQSRDMEAMPWYYPGLDPDFERALERYSIGPGKVLDLCTGPATQALALAERGFEVFATGISATAVKKGAAKAREQGLEIIFHQADILNDDLGENFEVIIDRGCFHVFQPHQRPIYIETVHALLQPGGYLILKCFSHKEKGSQGPYRFTPGQLEEYFSPALEILMIEDSKFSGTRNHYPQALISVMRKP